MSPRVLIGFAALCAAVSANAQSVQVGQKAPSFSLPALGGNVTFMEDIRARGNTTFIYFIDERDNVSGQASTAINHILRNYGKPLARWFGVINARDDRATAYKAEFQPPYPLLLDPEIRAATTYGFQRSPAVVMLDKDGKIAKIWSGLTVANLKDLNRTVAKVNGFKEKPLDTRTPTTSTFGKRFAVARKGAG